MSKLTNYPSDELGRYDLKELGEVVKWHKKKYPNEPKRSYMFSSDGVSVYTFYGDIKDLKAVDRFLKFYRKIRRFFYDR